MPVQRITAEELARLEPFAEDTAGAREWLAERLEVRHFQAGDVVARSGDPANELMVVLDGEFHFQRDNEPEGAGVYVRRPGEAAGMLPFSRMTVMRARGWAVQDGSRAVFMDAVHLPDLACKAPRLAQRLVGEMIDRNREVVLREERGNKMLALGKLSAGLAHELNNPASAVVRSSARLRELLLERRKHAMVIMSEPMPADAQTRILELGERIAVRAATPPESIDDLAMADCEAELTDYLDSHNMPLETAGSLAHAGIVRQDLEPLIALLGPARSGHGLFVLAADFEITSLSREIEEASRRIASLVQAVKSYSYMDRSSLGPVDVERDLDVTLRIFQHQLKHQGIQLVRRYANNLPVMQANGGELNQVWTNLIDNAIDAMQDSPQKVLEVRTCLEPGCILVEVADSGKGIPKEIESRIFDAFFTTKGVGKGTGLGLDIVHRILRNHRGSIQVRSAPGRTVFQVRLPVPPANPPPG